MSATPPLVSVVIPAFNAAAHLGQTIASAAAQTYGTIEIIVVNDGSTDATEAIAVEFSARDSRIRVVNQSNAGVGAARNAGIRLARGQYVAPLDADDLWAPNKLERQVACIQSAGLGTGLVYCWSRNIDQRDRVVSWGFPHRAEGRVGAAMLLGNFAGNASVPLFRASALATVGGYLTRAEQDGAQGCEDWDLNVRLAERFRLACVPDYLVSYRQSSSGMSLDVEGMARSYETVIHGARTRRPDLPARLFAWSASRFYSYLVSKCYGWSNYSGALFYLGKMLLADPASLLSARNHRIAALALTHLVTRGKLRRHGAPPAVTPAGDPLFKVTPAVVTAPRDLFAKIQDRRHQVALTARPRLQKLPAHVRGVFGYR
jgi:glycosyltransferase involved in cell wall biosynthesis